MLVIPAIDLRQGLCVRLTQGRKEDVKVYADDPVSVAHEFQAGGAVWLHVVDLDGAFSDPNSKNREVLREIIKAVEMRVQFGGGLRSLADIGQALDIGVSRVVLGTLAVKSPATVGEAVESFGREPIAVGIDADNGRALTHGWTTDSETSALKLAQSMAELDRRIVYTDIAATACSACQSESPAIARDSGLKVTAWAVWPRSGHAECALPAPGIDSVIIGKALTKAASPSKAIHEANEQALQAFRVQTLEPLANSKLPSWTGAQASSLQTSR